MAEALLSPAFGRGQHKDPAILCGDSVLSYGDLDTKANKAGNVFLELGVQQSDRVLMMVRDTPAFVYVYLGLMKIGAVPVGLSTRLAPQDTAYTIDDSKSGFFVLDAFFKDHFEEALALTPNLPRGLHGHKDLWRRGFGRPDGGCKARPQSSANALGCACILDVFVRHHWQTERRRPSAKNDSGRRQAYGRSVGGWAR